MASFHEILSIGQSGLNASRNLLQLASFNIANANTPGFSRRVQNLSAGAFPGQGVVVGDPTAIRSAVLRRNLVETSGRLGFHQGRLDAMTLAQEAFNDLDGVGVSSSLSEFENALAELSANPSSLPERQAVLGSAQSFISTMASSRQQLQSAFDTSLEQAQGIASDVSLKAQQVAQLNSKIRSLVHNGQDAGSLVDQRDAIVQELGSQVDVQVVPQTDGTVRLFTAGGRPLVAAEFASKLEVRSTPPAETEVVVVKPNGEELATLKPVGGQLGGHISAQNEDLASSIERLDELAFNYANAFNAAHESGFALDGTDGHSFFDVPPTAEGAAANLALSEDVAGQPGNIAAAGSATDAPGGNSNLETLQAISEQEGLLPSGLSVRGGLEALTFDQAQAVNSAETGISIEESSATQLENLIESQSGVNTDEELIKMTQANQAFEAAGLVVQRSDEMTQTLLSLLG
ncbi:MAG: flagellar hook-associated protein FlgK [Myxococcota bacterium]